MVLGVDHILLVLRMIACHEVVIIKINTTENVPGKRFYL